MERSPEIPAAAEDDVLIAPRLVIIHNSIAVSWVYNNTDVNPERQTRG